MGMYVLEKMEEKEKDNMALICEDCTWSIRVVEEISTVSPQF